jgi:hypothetical protein
MRCNILDKIDRVSAGEGIAGGGDVLSSGEKFVAVKGFGRRVALKGSHYERRALRKLDSELHPGHCGYEPHALTDCKRVPPVGDTLLSLPCLHLGIPPAQMSPMTGPQNT